MLLDRIIRFETCQVGLLLGLLLGLMGANAALATQVSSCHGPGDAVRLSGRVVLASHAGPPDYESVARGDAPEAHAVLHVRWPLCVTSVSADGATVRHHVQRLQLIDLRAGAVHQATLAGCRRSCTLKGRLMQAESGHHHTPFLLELD